MSFIESIDNVYIQCYDVYMDEGSGSLPNKEGIKKKMTIIVEKLNQVPTPYFHNKFFYAIRTDEAIDATQATEFLVNELNKIAKRGVKKSKSFSNMFEVTQLAHKKLESKLQKLLTKEA